MNRYWPEYGIGLVFTSNRSIKGMNEIQFLKDAFHCADICNMEDKGWKYYNNSKESGKGFFPFAEEKEYDEEPNEMLILWAKKQPTPFKAVYPDGMKELRKEFQDAVGEYLPPDFDWNAHIGYFHTVIYG